LSFIIISPFNAGNKPPSQRALNFKQRLLSVGLSDSCTPGMGVSLWGESPLYENRKVFITMDTNKSTSRRQGRFREEWSEGSRSANVRDDGQEPHIRLSLWASRHDTNEAHRFGGRVNAAFVHGKLTFLSGEICLSCGSIIMSKIRKRFTRLTKRTRHTRLLLGGYESRRETQNRQLLMMSPAAPCMATYRESIQKSAEGIVGRTTEGPNAEMSVAIP